LLLCCNVFSQKHHAKGTMVQRSDAAETPIQDLVFDKDIPHALHDGQFECTTFEMVVETGKQVDV
jgi:hypothetical protein